VATAATARVRRVTEWAISGTRSALAARRAAHSRATTRRRRSFGPRGTTAYSHAWQHAFDMVPSMRRGDGDGRLNNRRVSNTDAPMLRHAERQNLVFWRAVSSSRTRSRRRGWRRRARSTRRLASRRPIWVYPTSRGAQPRAACLSSTCSTSWRHFGRFEPHAPRWPLRCPTHRTRLPKSTAKHAADPPPSPPPSPPQSSPPIPSPSAPPSPLPSPHPSPPPSPRRFCGCPALRRARRRARRRLAAADPAAEHAALTII
jgi:hypothetical protein